jgi:hypothetical protein
LGTEELATTPSEIPQMPKRKVKEERKKLLKKYSGKPIGTDEPYVFPLEHLMDSVDYKKILNEFDKYQTQTEQKEFPYKYIEKEVTMIGKSIKQREQLEGYYRDNLPKIKPIEDDFAMADEEKQPLTFFDER